MEKATILKRLIREKFRNPRNFSVKSNIPYSTVRSVLERGVENSGVNTVLKIIGALDITMDELDMLAGINIFKGEYVMEDLIPYVPNIVRLPIVGIIRAGEPILSQDNIEGFFSLDSSTIEPEKTYFLLRVIGDSMNKEFREGDLLLIEKTPCIDSGEIGVVRVNEVEATVKKVLMHNDLIQLIPLSNNPIYLPQIIDPTKDKIEIIGKVKKAIKNY
ncbi:MAG TPA: S24 family peptidase [Clostridia bacterium]|nr:S24 family peptidase [Clostridia bacterium]